MKSVKISQKALINFPKIHKKIKHSIKWPIYFFSKIPQLKKLKNFIKEEIDPAINRSENFDEEFYLACYPDVAAANVNAYEHFINHGKNEGRIAVLPGVLSTLPSEKETVLVVSHEASRTGAPILAWNICQQLKSKFNVISFLFGGGEILPFFSETCDITLGPFSNHIERYHNDIANYLVKRYKIKFAIVNSFESRGILKSLSKNSIPSVFLMHEFYAYLAKDEFLPALTWASSTVFSAKIVQESAITAETHSIIADSYLLPQGKAKIPCIEKNPALIQEEVDQIKEQIFFRKGLLKTKKPFVVLGAGAIQYRKGTDLFIATAAEINRLDPNADILMIWIGDADSSHYTNLVTEQIERYNLQERCKLINATSNLEAIYSLADVFFLSSRLDPLPNVVIDAMSNGVPILCFEKSTGIIEFLQQDTETAKGIVPFANIFESAKRILELYHSPELHNLVSNKVAKIAQENFDMEKYVNKLVEIAEKQIDFVQQEKNDRTTLQNSTEFVESFYWPTYWQKSSRSEKIHDYIKKSYKGIYYRKPAPGFNPELYAKHHKLDRQTEPFIHFLHSGKPKGPWQEIVFQPQKNFDVKRQASLRCAIHIHAFYPDILQDILKRLALNHSEFDLFITTNTEAKAQECETLLLKYTKGRVVTKVVPNRGADIAPFLLGFKAELQDYDVIGHLHTKKSPHLPRPFAEAWVNFLLENLLGGQYNMADQIISKFQQEPKLGIAYPDDPHLMGWLNNLPIAEQLTKQLGLENLPNQSFSFPIGTMFWARPTALKPLFDLQSNWDVYPTAPMPIDGTLVHALERLFPLVVEKTGFNRIVTNVPGITR